MEKYECTMLGNKDERNGINIGFIYAKKSSKIIKEWAEEIPNRVKKYKNYERLKLLFKLFKKQEYKETKHWAYFGNKILDPLIENSYDDSFFILDRNNINSLLENEVIDENAPERRYQKFYFENCDYKQALKKNKGVIYLHNSWTPNEYREMSEQDFLNSNVTLALLLKEILEK